MEISAIFNPNNYTWNPWSIPPFISSIYLLSLGLFVLAKNVKSRINLSYCILVSTSALWLFSYAVGFSNNTPEGGLFWSRNAYFGINFIAVTMYWFVVELLDLKNLRKLVYLFYGLMIAFIPVTRTRYFLAGVIKYYWGYYPFKGSILYDIFILSFCAYWGAALWYVYRAYKKEDSLLRKTQLKLVAAAILVVTFAFVDFVGKYKLEVYPWGYAPVAVFLSIFFYAIARYKLFEIDTVIHQTILWFITLVLLIFPVGIGGVVLRDWTKRLSNPELIMLIVAVLVFFIWYYTQLKPKVDHLFRRRKYDYYKVLSEIGQKIGSELDIQHVISRLFKELKEILYIRNGMVLVQQPGQMDYIDIGRVGYDQLEKEEKKAAGALQYQSELSKWFGVYRKALEKEQIEIDPKYGIIKQEALSFLRDSAIEVLIPVIMEDKVNGFVGLGKKENLQSYTIRDIELLEHMGRQIGITIDNALHHEDIVEKERLAEELKLGREIQMALLPQESPKIKGLIVQGLMQPAKEIGGDYYDFISFPKDDQLGVVIGDVSGKGVGAGLLMAMTKSAIHILSGEELSPRQILLKTNQLLNRYISGQKFMTMLYFLWNANNKTMLYSSAGHEHILVYRNVSGKIESIRSGGFMLGMMSDIERFMEENTIQLETKDKILLYTDGVTEAQSQSEERFGLERLKEVLIRHGQKPAGDLMQAVKDEVYAFIGLQSQFDDITIVVLEAT